MNPAAVAEKQRQQELSRLKEDNERLAARVQLLEKAGSPVEDLTMQVDKQLETVPESKAIEGKAGFPIAMKRDFLAVRKVCELQQRFFTSVLNF
jgi:hypothetical protein